MLFLAWLAVCLLAAGSINLYLRRFGLPRRRRKTAGSGESGSTGYGSIGYSEPGGLLQQLQGVAFSRGAAGPAGATAGEAGQWVNGVISWIHQTQESLPDFVNSWLAALTAEAEQHTKEMEILFAGIHGSPPEFLDFRTESSSSDEEVLTVAATVTLKDVTLQTSVLGQSTTTKAKQLVKCDVYIQSLTGQVISQTRLQHNELSVQLEFASEPNLRLQIRPTRVDYTVDNEALKKVVRAAISKSPMRINWTLHSTDRTSHLRIVEPSKNDSSPTTHLPTGSKLSPVSLTTSGHSSFVDNCDVSPAAPSAASAFVTPSPPRSTASHSNPEVDQSLQTNQPEESECIRDGHPLTSCSGQHDLQRPATLTRWRQQTTPSSIQGQECSRPVHEQQNPNQPQGQASPETPKGLQLASTQRQQSEAFSQGAKLLIRVVKANGLMDKDFGSCSGFCRVHIDTPPQDFVTSVIRNAVNPYWDEQFISDFDPTTKQIQFEVLDSDRQKSDELIGKAVVLVNEIRRMPSSRQIIPLTGKPKSRTSTSGSVTVEFIFEDSPATQSFSSTDSSTPFGSQGSNNNASGRKQSMSSTTQPTTHVSLTRKGNRAGIETADCSPYGDRSNPSTFGASQLSAHNLALTSSQPAGTRTRDSLTVVVTGAEEKKQVTSQHSTSCGASAATDRAEEKKKGSFASALKRTLGRVKNRSRSQSTDRYTGRSLREGHLLRPPDDYGHVVGQQREKNENQQQMNRDTGSASDLEASAVGSDGAIRHGRSNSLGSNLRRFFRRNRKENVDRQCSIATKPAVPSSSYSFSFSPHATSSSSSSSTPMQLRGGDSECGEVPNVPSQRFERSRRQDTSEPSGVRFAAEGESDLAHSLSPSLQKT